MGTIGLCALVPRRPTLWADAGRRSLTAYLLHLYVLPAVEVPFSAAVQVAAISAHAELAAPVALCGCLLLVHALGLPLPDVGGAWAAARRAVVRRAERAPLHVCGGADASQEQSRKLLEPPGSPDSV